VLLGTVGIITLAFVSLVAFAVLSAGVLTAYHYLLEPDLSLAGCLVGIAVATAILAAVIAWGVTVGAMSNGTVIGVTLFWLVLFGGLFLLSFLPAPFSNGANTLSALRSTLRGHYDPTKVAWVIGVCLLVAGIGGAVGVVGYSKKDV
jgi:ABC-2 type transport system permease protein